ncbi:helix-turn-helix domain-containing protein [Burkholderia cepacia]|uniref:helix-turn-helix domain-containing protein n=1 Tax=Burkholderia cepacia TaxID=292 RepID=UPI00158A57FF|nr:AraC family transcriptional regulator [Burkholderia cepacia]
MNDDFGSNPDSDGSITTDETDKFGCPSGLFSITDGVIAGGATFYRKKMENLDKLIVSNTRTKKSFIVGVSLSTGHQREILTGSDRGTYKFGRNSIHIRNADEPYSARITGTYDFVVAEVPKFWLTRIDTDFLRSGSTGLSSPTGCVDDILGHLVRCIFSPSYGTNKIEPCFAEQIGIAFGLRLLEKYGRSESKASIGSLRLAKWQEDLAKDLLLCNATKATSIADIATACQVSTSYFIRAFKSSMGYSPYQWQLRERIGMAKRLLQDNQLSISSIAEACGFSDVYQFSRSFTKIVGITASQWKKYYAAKATRIDPLE